MNMGFDVCEFCWRCFWVLARQFQSGNLKQSDLEEKTVVQGRVRMSTIEKIEALVNCSVVMRCRSLDEDTLDVFD
jgi:hypothetical protein